MTQEEALIKLKELQPFCSENIAGDAINFAIDMLEKDSGEISDGYHTFDSLYLQRRILFAIIVNMNKSKCWKTRKHEDDQLCFGGGWFLVTIETPEGNYGYHCEDEYWDLFDCRELKKAKHWDGYTDKDVTRLLSLLNDVENSQHRKQRGRTAPNNNSENKDE